MAKTPFKMKSGNSPIYKNLGSSPMKDVEEDELELNLKKQKLKEGIRERRTIGEKVRDTASMVFGGKTTEGTTYK